MDCFRSTSRCLDHLLSILPKNEADQKKKKKNFTLGNLKQQNDYLWESLIIIEVKKRAKQLNKWFLWCWINKHWSFRYIWFYYILLIDIINYIITYSRLVLFSKIYFSLSQIYFDLWFPIINLLINYFHLLTLHSSDFYRSSKFWCLHFRTSYRLWKKRRKDEWIKIKWRFYFTFYLCSQSHLGFEDVWYIEYVMIDVMKHKH